VRPGARLIVWCRDCRHRVEPDPADMAERYGGLSALRAFLEGYHNTAETNQPTVPQNAAHNPNDRNNTAVIDTRLDQ
jgi:hypothetical protein